MSSKLPAIFGVIGLISILAGSGYYFMYRNKDGNNYSTDDYGANKGPQNNRVIFSNAKVNPEPEGLINNYFGGKRSKKKKYSRKKSKKNGKK